jgi:glycosyltransferase involved in cell wall biosynthesis
VSLDLGARREAIVDGVTGALAKEPTAAALADALVEVLKDPARCQAMGDAARAYAAAHFSWDVTANTIGRILEQQRRTVEATASSGDFLCDSRITDNVPNLVGHA